MAFVGFTVAAPLVGAGWLPGELFSRLDPLVGLTAVVASRTWIGFATLGLLTVGLTLLFGRGWCGWLCPLGATLDILPGRRRGAGDRLSTRWRVGKYVTLTAIVGAAVFGTLWPMILDPVTIAMRPIQELIMPAVGADALGLSVGEYVGRSAVRQVAFLSLVPLVAVLALNAVEKRFWCGSLCPLGGMLALCSAVPGVRRLVDADACTSCGRCARECPTHAIDPAAGFASSASQCVTCAHCVDTCPQGAITFGARRSLLPSFDPERREVVTTAGAAGAGLVASVVVPGLGEERVILRPPATDERRLAEQCVRCGACYAACPSASLSPSLSLQGAGLWTPMLEVRPPHCSLECNLCGEVCPTDAIHVPTPAEAAMLGLGRYAKVDIGRCISWARGRQCLKCLRVCPIREAIVPIDEYRDVRTVDSNVRLPTVDADLCVACDVCAGVCPVYPPAIGTHIT